MKRFPAEFFQTGLFGASEALLSESTYNPPSEPEVESSPVIRMASQISEEEKKYTINQKQWICSRVESQNKIF